MSAVEDEHVNCDDGNGRWRKTTQTYQLQRVLQCKSVTRRKGGMHDGMGSSPKCLDVYLYNGEIVVQKVYMHFSRCSNPHHVCIN